jgi:hypothetical protein
MKTIDITETVRRGLCAKINSERSERELLEDKYGQVWDTGEMQKDFSVESFAAPLIIVSRKSDGTRGTLFFQHSPRFYWGFK